MNMNISKIAVVLGVILLTVFTIYLTPLKHLNIIDPNPNDVDPKEFWDAYQKNPGGYLFLDVRNQTVYDTSHAKGAINQPIASMFDLRHDFPKSGKKIVLICTSGRLAGVAYGFLQDWGHLNLIRIKGGLQNWVAEGLPIEGNDITAPLPERD